MTPRMLSRAVSLLATAVTLVALVACQNPAAAGTQNPSNPSNTNSDPSKIGFEGTLTLSNYTYSNGDHASGDEAMVFTADTTRFKTGAQSLHLHGTSLENQYALGTFHTELNLPVGATTDFTGKTVTAQVYLPAGSPVTGVNLTFFDAAGGVWMVNTEAAVVAGQWNAVSFTASDKGYATLSGVTAITKLRFRFLTGAASATVDANIDSINW